MQSKQKDLNEMFYAIFEDKKVIKFIEKHINDTDLLNRIEEKYYSLVINPYEEAENLLKV